MHSFPQVDDNIGLLMSELERTGLWGRINVVITSDHGMAQCSTDRVIRLDDCLHPDNYTALELSPVASIIPLAGNQMTSLTSALNDAAPNRRFWFEEFFCHPLQIQKLFTPC